MSLYMYTRTKELIKARSVAHKTAALQYDRPVVGPPFDDLQLPSIDEVRKLITSMPGKSSPVDHIPTSVIKSCVDVFALLIAHLAKLSFSEGKVPMRYKTASIIPLLKKKETDPEVATNYRPISNLHVLPAVVVLAHGQPPV